MVFLPQGRSLASNSYTTNDRFLRVTLTYHMLAAKYKNYNSIILCSYLLRMPAKYLDLTTNLQVGNKHITSVINYIIDQYGDNTIKHFSINTILSSFFNSNLIGPYLKCYCTDFENFTVLEARFPSSDFHESKAFAKLVKFQSI